MEELLSASRTQNEDVVRPEDATRRVHVQHSRVVGVVPRFGHVRVRGIAVATLRHNMQQPFPSFCHRVLPTLEACNVFILLFLPSLGASGKNKVPWFLYGAISN